MRRRKLDLHAALAITSVLLAMFVLSFNVSGPKVALAETSNLLAPVLITSLVECKRDMLDVYQWQGVNWVIFYCPFSKEDVRYVHSLGMKALAYVSALKEYSDMTLYPDKTWAQFDGSRYVHPADMSTREIWFSPWGPYVDQVLLPRVRDALRKDMDGIFLDTLILYPGADQGPYARDAWTKRYSYYFPFASQEFRFESTLNVLQRVYETARAERNGAVLMVSNNNVFKDADRIKFASSIEKWQAYADGFVLEYLGIDPDRTDWTAGTPQQIVNNLLLAERNNRGVYRPLWLLYYTAIDSRFEYLVSKSRELNFGYWAYEKYLLQHNLITYGGRAYRYALDGNSSISNLKFDRSRRLLNFTLEAPDNTEGWIRLKVPIALLDGRPVVSIDEKEIARIAVNENGTHYDITATYSHSRLKVSVGGSNTIPEFAHTTAVQTITLVILAIVMSVHRRLRRGQARSQNLGPRHASTR